jgi:Flp pilus assembly protein TadD
MNPLSRRRSERRRLIAEWAARASRVTRGDAGPPAADGCYAGEERSGPPARRLPFELLDPRAPIALVQPAPNGNGDGAQEPVDSAEPVEPEPPGVARGTVPETEEPAAPRAPAATEPPQPAVTVQTDALLQAARSAMDAGDVARAGQLYREVLERDPESLRARNGLALVLDASGEHEAALEQLDRCRAQDQGNLEVAVNRCGVLGMLGRYSDAERGLRVVLERDPGSAAAHFQLGLVVSRRGRWRDAVPWLLQATALDPTLAGAHFYLGEALNHVDDLPGALQAYQRTVELSPRHAKAWYGMGIVLDRMNRPDDAAQSYRHSRELQGK